jgi:hypothetical protein
MKIIEKKISELIRAEYNPRRLTKEQYKQLKESLLAFGLVDPVLVNINEERKNVIIGGHQRAKVWSDLGHKSIPCIEFDLSLEKEKELNVRLNKNTGEFDFAMLANFFNEDKLIEWGFDEIEFDTSFEEEEEKKDSYLDENGNPYTAKVEAPIYSITGEKPKIEELFNFEKTNKIQERIEKAEVPKEIKEFLKFASFRHTVFRYDKIAEYYAHANIDVQELFEDSALVIIDFEKAIEKGFVKLTKAVGENYATSE